MKRPHLALIAGLCWLASASAAQAELPSWLKKHNGDVDDGNDALQKGDAKGALEAYNRAARRLPDAPGVSLDRGIALLKQGDYGKAREALLSATVPIASADLRADAYQNLALSFYREADGLATQNNHAEAQKLFREAVDSAKRSLHLRPGDPNAAWNLELAARRLREEEQKQKQKEEEQKQKEQNKDQQKQDQQNQDQQNQDQQNQDQQNQDQQNQDQQKQDQQKQDQSGQDKDKPDKPEPKKPEEQKAQGDKPKQPEKPQADQQPGEPKDQPKALPPEAEQALDSLENGEENFERYRARQRASRERRAPEKDW